jgi:hypothetical protein
MTKPARFLHVTDTHITGAGVPFRRDDHKERIPGIDHATREAALELVFERLSERLQADGETLDAVIFTGDATLKGDEGGHRALLELLLKHFATVGITPPRIVATPGNHDVPKGTMPGSNDRYEVFLKVWRNAGCITPWIDGIDPAKTKKPEMHRLVDPDGRWAIYPINSANWSHVNSILPSPLQDIWDDAHRVLAKRDAEKAADLRKQFDDLAQFDMARVSELQLEEVRRIVDGTPTIASRRPIRIAAIHHHLHAPSLREEVKAFADFTKLELLRQTLRERSIDVVMHGHKHEHAARFDYIYDDQGGEPRRTLVLSGATFDEKRDGDAARLITLTGMPFAPSLATAPIAVPRGGTELRIGSSGHFRLWSTDRQPGGPIVVQGTDLETVYHQACVLADQDAKHGTLIAHLDLAADQAIMLPADYPLPDSMTQQDRQTWLDELVSWWQMDRSQLDQRIPFIHGNRLRRFAGSIDQINRIRKLLAKKGSSRAVATLVDPARDFEPDGNDETFASFCLVQFRKHTVGSAAVIDVIGYYRAQEFARWWPINVAELRALQSSVVQGSCMKRGRITTITAEARSIGKSPTQVAMPVIDRWLDQYPERLYVLANTFLGADASLPLKPLVIREWFQTLDDLKEATERFNPDGVPIAIEGLEALASYLEVSNATGDAAALLRALRGLVTANRSYSATPQAFEDFTRWGASDYLAAVREASYKLLGQEL